MKTVVGIFGSASAAEKATTSLIDAGFSPTRIRRLTPGSTEGEIHSAVPTSETEQGGMGTAIGAVVGGVAGITLLLGLEAVLTGGTGLLTAMNTLLAVLGAAVGAAIGAFAGRALEDRLSPGLPKDEIYFYEEALRRGRCVVFALASNGRQEEIARRTLGRAGADSLDAGDENWRVGLERPNGIHRGATGRRAS